eukprot:TRINITY_DN44616_c0_g1_i1.p1 TRINITY_DN44616_c0_g1~~TRINITY_DN44616_c0_g1_i1.p1  ORF type:complete len:571 (+),score=222.33 TRINITY_DN44616_c0_g1_i1:68-1714(+)
MSAAAAAGELPFEALLYFAHRPELVDFREDELRACARTCLTRVEVLACTEEESSFMTVRFESAEAARAVCSRMVLLHGVYQVLGKGMSYDELCEGLSRLPADVIEPLRTKRFRFVHDALGRSYTREEQVACFNRFTFLRLGVVDLKSPEEIFWVIEDWRHDGAAEAPRGIYLARQVSLGARSLLDKYTLKRRKFIGTTTMMPELCFLMANCGCVQKGSWVWDPFCGTGSTLVSCAHYGAAVWGSDLDGRRMGSTADGGILDNCTQYGFQPAELLRLDVSQCAMWRPESLDCMVCDPPYGRRESNKKIDSAKQDRIDRFLAGLTEQQRQDRAEARREHYVPPPKEEYRLEDLFADLIGLAGKYLAVGGRLVYWHPTTASYDSSEVPTHPCLRMLSDNGQSVSIRLKRRLVILEKTRRWKEGDTATAGRAQDHDGFHYQEEAECPDYKSYMAKREKRRAAVQKFKEKMEAEGVPRPERQTKAERRRQQLERAQQKAEIRAEKQRRNHEQMAEISARIRQEKEQAKKRARTEPDTSAPAPAAAAPAPMSTD